VVTGFCSQPSQKNVMMQITLPAISAPLPVLLSQLVLAAGDLQVAVVAVVAEAIVT
jgi:hypothetical protein